MILVLDLDGVVVLGHPDGGRWDKDLERDLNIAPAAMQMQFFNPHFHDVVTGRADMIEVLERIWPTLGHETTVREFVDYWFAKDSRIDSDVLSQVDVWRANGGKAFLATVQERHRARYVWESLGLSRHFQGIIYSADIGAVKPDTEFYARAQAMLPNCAPKDVLFFDDKPANVDAANAFGWKATLHRSAEDLRAALMSVEPSR